MSPDDRAAVLRDEPALRGVRLLVLHGSRARGSAGTDSDWDFGVLGADEVDLTALRTALTLILRTDAVDLVDQKRASALLRYRAARDGVVVAGSSDEFLEFRLEAVGFWCDAGPVIRPAQDGGAGGLRPRRVLAAHGIELARAWMSSRLTVLHVLADAETAGQARTAWTGLSRACHRHAFDYHLPRPRCGRYSPTSRHSLSEPDKGTHRTVREPGLAA